MKYKSIFKSLLYSEIFTIQTYILILNPPAEETNQLKARETLIKFDEDFWTKKNSSTPFDVTMGANDSAQVTDLVGLYILHELTLKTELTHNRSKAHGIP